MDRWQVSHVEIVIEIGQVTSLHKPDRHFFSIIIVYCKRSGKVSVW